MFISLHANITLLMSVFTGVMYLVVRGFRRARFEACKSTLGVQELWNNVRRNLLGHDVDASACAPTSTLWEMFDMPVLVCVLGWVLWIALLLMREKVIKLRFTRAMIRLITLGYYGGLALVAYRLWQRVMALNPF